VIEIGDLAVLVLVERVDPFSGIQRIGVRRVRGLGAKQVAALIEEFSSS